MIKKEWTVLCPNPNGDLIASILAARKIRNPVHFLQPKETDMLPYEDLSDIGQAAGIYLKAIEENKRIHILADVDLDGCASNAILYRYSKHFTDNITWSINVGKKHGLNMDDLPAYVGKYDLVIAVDSSSKSKDEQKFLIDNGIQVIVLDHHPCNVEECPAVIVNSQLNGYKNSALAGAGVVFKFVKYLDVLQGTNFADEYWDLAASGIIGDMQDISEDSMENRLICFNGFNKLKNPGLKEIIGKYQFNGTSISYSIAPIINSGVRMKQDELSAQLLLEDDKTEVNKIIQKLKDLKEIQNHQKDILVEYLKSEIENKNMQNQKVMGFVIPERNGEFEADITGLVATVISAEYDSLVIIVHPSDEEGVLKGSIRGNGVPSFRKLVLNSGLAIMCEGHDPAAGISVYESNFQNLIDTLNKQLENTELKIISNADVVLEPKDLSLMLIKKIEYVNIISGTGFEPIKVMIKGLEPYEINNMQHKHSKFSAKSMNFIQWNSDLCHKLECQEGIYAVIDVIGTPGLNNFRGEITKQLIISDYKIEKKLEFFR